MCYVRALRSVSARHSLTRARAWMIPETQTKRGIRHSRSLYIMSEVAIFLESISCPEVKLVCVGYNVG